MTKHTATMSEAWTFHDKQTDAMSGGLTISWQSKQIIYLGLDHLMTKHTGAMSWCLTISWQTTLIPCLRFDILITKPTDSMSGSWPFHDKKTDTMSGAWQFHEKTDWYYVWGLTISWKNRLLLCPGIDHLMTKQANTISEDWPFHDKQTDTLSGAWPFPQKTDWFFIWAFPISLIAKLTVNMFGVWSFH